MGNILISVVLLIGAAAIQIKFFLQTQKTRQIFKNIFPKDLDKVLSTYKDEVIQYKYGLVRRSNRVLYFLTLYQALIIT